MPASWRAPPSRRGGHRSSASLSSTSPPSFTTCAATIRPGRRLCAPTITLKRKTLAAALRASGSEGIVYPSQRDPGGECAGLFYPDRASHVVQGRHLDYHWNGARVDFYRDGGSGEVFRVG